MPLADEAGAAMYARGAVLRLPSVRPSASPRQRPSQPGVSHPSGLQATYRTTAHRSLAWNSLFGQEFRSTQRRRPWHQKCKGRQFRADADDPRPAAPGAGLPQSREDQPVRTRLSAGNARSRTYTDCRLQITLPVVRVKCAGNTTPVEIAPPLIRQ